MLNAGQENRKLNDCYHTRNSTLTQVGTLQVVLIKFYREINIISVKQTMATIRGVAWWWLLFDHQVHQYHFNLRRGLFGPPTSMIKKKIPTIYTLDIN